MKKLYFIGGDTDGANGPFTSIAECEQYIEGIFDDGLEFEIYEAKLCGKLMCQIEKKITYQPIKVKK